LVGLLGGACLGTPQHPPQIQGQAPKNPQKATRLCHQKGIDGGMFFLPLRWTERIGSCRANAMVVPTGWFACLRYLILQLVSIGIHDSWKSSLCNNCFTT
ncbi:MAG: hypothetical protein NTW61_03310, partial [Candidatus Melainabacteria bacterium]|nr:hypothetical protein [Candidatus Melainabacteria bacterium]